MKVHPVPSLALITVIEKTTHLSRVCVLIALTSTNIIIIIIIIICTEQVMH